ncbi:hypothetical protein [Occallatibacter savannae]|uniref:hypothetical protein n=1 Tax=Occallatibacter savannae TaxID=1002691 RepID=UPI0013A5722A|nr:hypothetical protein [Occallatibacter savannae]
MSPFTCPRERELSTLLHSGHWPRACPDDLHTHVASCRNCSDLVLVTGALQAARRHTVELPRLEPAGAIWWRAQLRRRNAAIEKVGRPILGAQIFAVAMALVVVAAIAISQFGNWSVWFSDLPGTFHLTALIPSSMSENSTLWIIVPVITTIALLSGILAYFASEKQ